MNRQKKVRKPKSVSTEAIRNFFFKSILQTWVGGVDGVELKGDSRYDRIIQFERGDWRFVERYRLSAPHRGGGKITIYYSGEEVWSMTRRGNCPAEKISTLRHALLQSYRGWLLFHGAPGSMHGRNRGAVYESRELSPGSFEEFCVDFKIQEGGRRAISKIFAHFIFFRGSLS